MHLKSRPDGERQLVIEVATNGLLAGPLPSLVLSLLLALSLRQAGLPRLPHEELTPMTIDLVPSDPRPSFRARGRPLQVAIFIFGGVLGVVALVIYKHIHGQNAGY
jgi:hypothetical protein